MFGHHKDRHGQASQASQARQWVPMLGRVLDQQTLPGPSAPHPKLVTVELRPDGRAPFSAQVHLEFPDRWEEDLYYPQVGDERQFLHDPGSGEARFDMTDPRNSMSAHTLASEAWAAAPDNDDPDDLGPPWLVAANCAYCEAPVDQRWAAMQPLPQCLACDQDLIVYPLVTDAIRREASS